MEVLDLKLNFKYKYKGNFQVILSIFYNKLITKNLILIFKYSAFGWNFRKNGM